MANSRMTPDVAEQTRAQLLGIDRLLIDHLTQEDDYLYPALMQAEDADVRATARGCFEDMGGILGAWIAYRDQWTGPAIQASPDRFRVASDGVIGALAMRVERENSELYPLMDGLTSHAGDAERAA